MSAKKIKGYLVEFSKKTGKVVMTSYNTGRLIETFDNKMQLDEFLEKDRTYVKYSPSLGGDVSYDEKKKKRESDK